MTVTSSLDAGVTRITQIDQSTKLSAALKVSAPVSTAVDSTDNTDPSLESAAVDTSALAQSPTVSFRLDALGIAASGTQVDVLDSGAMQVSRMLGQLQSLAARASTGGLSKSALAQLDGQFQALRLAINNVPPGPPNDDVPVSDLTQGVAGITSNSTAVVGGFNDQKLLGDANLQTPEAALSASATIAQASQTIDAQRATLADVRDQLDFASASVDSAIQNQDALRSTLNVDDLSGGNQQSSLAASLLANPQAAISAQTSKLPANVLQLLQ